MLEITGYSFPNDVHISWSLMVVMYPYITGIVAGAFIVSSLYHVFNREEFRPIARLSLLVSFAFLLVAPLPLANHIGQPLRGFFIFATPHFSSAMAGFGILYSLYLLLLSLEIWFVLRGDIIALARRSRGLLRKLYSALALWTYDTSPAALELDRRITRTLAAIGIPGACLLHGYVGFIFGALKSNPWWSTPLMPVIFLVSAIVSGIAMLIILYQIAMKLLGQPISRDCVQSLSRWLWLFMILTVTLELLEIITLAYEGAEEWEVIGPLLVNQLSVSFISIQMIIGALIPFILLMIVVLMNPYLHDRIRNTLTFAASSLLLVQVFSMRWNVVIGGQIFSKSLRGYRSGYSPQFLEREGILAAILIFILPFILLLVLERFFPLWGPLQKSETVPASPDTNPSE
ncbi:NrfD/PsrC family molybdoenzyme membrane anchor subunit [candidate division KSB1 bacterium]